MACVDERLFQALSDWQCWDMPLTSKPVLVKELLGGKTNCSFMVGTDCGEVVVRINAENSSNLGIDRTRESQILSLVSNLGCVPQTFFISEQVLVSQYITGRCWKADDLKNQNNLQKLSLLLDKIQRIPLPESSIKRNYVAYCQHYIQQLPQPLQRAEKSYIKELNEAAKVIDQADWQPVINHHDLVPENIVASGEDLFLLDWEYAAYGHPGIDFVRLYGESYHGALAKELYFLQQGIDKLWWLVNR